MGLQECVLLKANSLTYAQFRIGFHEVTNYPSLHC